MSKEPFDYDGLAINTKQGLFLLENKLVNRLLVLVDTQHKDEKDMLEIQVLSKAMSHIPCRLNRQTEER